MAILSLNIITGYVKFYFPLDVRVGHMKIIHTIKLLILLNLHRCQTCSYACRTTSQLVVHLRKHTGDAPFSCLYCDSKFKIKSDMKRHMRTHTGEKPFKCEQCDFSCSAKSKYTCALSSSKQIFKYVINI